MYWIKRQAQERRERQAELISSMKNTPNEEDRDWQSYAFLSTANETESCRQKLIDAREKLRIYRMSHIALIIEIRLGELQ